MVKTKLNTVGAFSRMCASNPKYLKIEVKLFYTLPPLKIYLLRQNVSVSGGRVWVCACMQVCVCARICAHLLNEAFRCSCNSLPSCPQTSKEFGVWVLRQAESEPHKGPLWRVRGRGNLESHPSPSSLLAPSNPEGQHLVYSPLCLLLHSLAFQFTALTQRIHFKRLCHFFYMSNQWLMLWLMCQVILKWQQIDHQVLSQFSYLMIRN